MAFKMSQECPTVSLDVIAEDFHILHSAYVLHFKVKTNWLPNTHTQTYNWLPTHTHTHTTDTWPATTTNKKQLGTSHLLLMVISLAQTLLSCAKFRLLRVIIIKDLKKIFCWHCWHVGMPAGFAPTKECFKHLRWFGKRHKTDAFTKLGEPTIRAACTPQTVLDRHF